MEKVKQEKDYRDWLIDDIIAWCQANDQVAWLKTTAAKKIKHPIYPKVANISKTGKKTHKMDKTKEPIGYEESAITFVELKREFINTFFEKKEDEKKPSMYDIIAAL